MRDKSMSFELRLATEADDIAAAERLRYRVFVTELGGDGPLVDHDAKRERDAYDRFFDHLILVDPLRDPAGLDHVIGVYRLLRGDMAARMGQFYSEDEYDLTALRNTGRQLLELGRSCVDPAYRGGSALVHLWGGLAQYVRDHSSEVLFGVASFHGTDAAALAAPLSVLHHRHLAPPALRVRARAAQYQPMNLMSEAEIDRPMAMRAVPALIKAYLRLGGCVGDGAFIDRAFNTTDVCLVMDTDAMDARQSSLYTKLRA